MEEDEAIEKAMKDHGWANVFDNKLDCARDRCSICKGVTNGPIINGNFRDWLSNFNSNNNAHFSTLRSNRAECWKALLVVH